VALSSAGRTEGTILVLFEPGDHRICDMSGGAISIYDEICSLRQAFEDLELCRVLLPARSFARPHSLAG
jgi:hypothetical protein